MKITINGQPVIELSEVQKNVIKNDIPEEIFESDMIRRLSWTVDYPCDKCYESHKSRWHDVMKSNGAKSVPSDKMALAQEYFKYAPCDLPEGQDKDLKVSVDGNDVFSISPIHKRMLVLSGHADPDNHCKSQMAWILRHKYERCMKRLRDEWEPKLASKGIASIPLDDDEFANLVFSQPEYKNRSKRGN